MLLITEWHNWVLMTGIIISLKSTFTKLQNITRATCLVEVTQINLPLPWSCNPYFRSSWWCVIKMSQLVLWMPIYVLGSPGRVSQHYLFSGGLGQRLLFCVGRAAQSWLQISKHCPEWIRTGKFKPPYTTYNLRHQVYFCVAILNTFLRNIVTLIFIQYFPPTTTLIRQQKLTPLEHLKR